MYEEARPVAVPLFFRSKARINMTPLDAAIAWIQKGYSPVPIPHRSKRPVLKEWEQLEITTDAAPQYFNGNQQNIGVHLGDKYGSADVDCDCPEAISVARTLLPATGLIFGRQSKPFSHFFYRSDPPLRASHRSADSILPEMGPLANGRFKVEEPAPFQLDQGSWRRLGRRLAD